MAFEPVHIRPHPKCAGTTDEAPTGETCSPATHPENQLILFRYLEDTAE